MSPKLSLEELVCGELTLKTGEKYDEIIRVDINRMFGGSNKTPLLSEMDGLSWRVRRNRKDGKVRPVCETEKTRMDRHVTGASR